MSFRGDGEQEELNKRVEKVIKTITTEPKFFGKKAKRKVIEVRVDKDSGSKRIVAEIDRKGKRTDKVYLGKILTRTDNVYPWWERAKVRKAVRKFLRSRRQSSIKVAHIGDGKIVLSDEDERILDEEI